MHAHHLDVLPILVEFFLQAYLVLHLILLQSTVNQIAIHKPQTHPQQSKDEIV